MMTDIVERLQQSMRAGDLTNEAADVIEDLRKQLADCQTAQDQAISEVAKWAREAGSAQARGAKLRDFIFDYIDLEPNNERMIAKYDECVKSSDDTALRQANEAYLNASPEVQLLNMIGGLLEDVEYTGSYLHGIIAYGKQAKKEALMEAAKDFDKSEYLEQCGGFNFSRDLRRMSEEIK